MDESEVGSFAAVDTTVLACQAARPAAAAPTGGPPTARDTAVGSNEGRDPGDVKAEGSDADPPPRRTRRSGRSGKICDRRGVLTLRV